MTSASPATAPASATPPRGSFDEAALPPADRLMRKLLRLNGTTPAGKITETGETQMGRSIMASAIRCTLTYLVIPIAGPTIGILGTLAIPVSLLLSFVAGMFSIRSMRTFWRTNHRMRWAYTAFAAVILVLLTYGVIQDIRMLIAR